MNIHDLAEWPRWGDLGNGYYRNPVLNADVSDPDVIRVGDDFYMVCSDFHFMGMQVFHSKDLVNWSLTGKVYERLDIDPAYDEMRGYAKGSWAPAIRYYDGRFYVYFCTPDEGLYMSSASHPAGPWEPLHEVARISGWEDPCPFWDEDGQAYLGHSTVGAGPIVLHRMSKDGKRLLDPGTIVYVGKIAEGTKIYKRNGYYYFIIPEGGVETGWQTVLRSGSLYGPYERKVVLQQGATAVNGPHQGAIVELRNGETWFLHFNSSGALGRVCHLQPVRWEDDWPVIGMNGEPVDIYAKPGIAGSHLPALPATSDDFLGPELGLQWQWNHNPVHGNWSLTKNGLRLQALKARDLLHARNTLTQKIIGQRGTASTELFIGAMKTGQRAGFAFLCAREENWIGAVSEPEGIYLRAVTGGTVFHGPKLAGETVKLGSLIDLDGETRFIFSLGEEWIPFGGPCLMLPGFWKGARLGLFSYTSEVTGGNADFKWFQYDVHRGGA
ncbi:MULTISPECIES: glycoside hydrolase family 43 protein [Paenibacillus]|uniref:Beta-xylosidase n=1 Tax=Paenibacillus borealis TaxID=160799 RepID=A0ABX3GZY7_PAEBO|nr:glycoside hydrolase 43 family protein [Paenibacillus borealis]OMD39636.1 beta-xylosidase [Paenibacillus borealis]